MLYQVKAGIIGLDKLGMAYAELLKDHVKNLSLIAASGRTQKELLYAKNTLSLEYVYGDEKSLLDSHDVDAVIMLPEPQLKANLAIQAIEAGKHVFLLNPIALNLDDAKAVMKTAASHPSQTVMVASPIKSVPILKKLKEFIESGRLGKISYAQIDSSFFQSLRKTYAKGTGSRYLDKLLDEIELYNWLSEDKATHAEVQSSDDLKICKLRRQNHDICQFMFAQKPHKKHGVLMIYGENGQILLSNDRPFGFSFFSADGGKEIIELDSRLMFSHPEYLQLNMFARSILGKDKNAYKPDAAVESMHIALSFEKSDVLNKTVELDEPV